MMKNKLFVARDKDGSLGLFSAKPYKEDDCWWCTVNDSEQKLDSYFMSLPVDWFPEVTWENSPKEVELNLKIK